MVISPWGPHAYIKWRPAILGITWALGRTEEATSLYFFNKKLQKYKAT